MKNGFGLLLKVSRSLFHDSQIEDVVAKLGRNQDSIYGGLLVKTLLARTFLFWNLILFLIFKFLLIASS